MSVSYIIYFACSITTLPGDWLTAQSVDACWRCRRHDEKLVSRQEGASSGKLLSTKRNGGEIYLYFHSILAVAPALNCLPIWDLRLWIMAGRSLPGVTVEETSYDERHDARQSLVKEYHRTWQFNYPFWFSRKVKRHYFKSCPSWHNLTTSRDLVWQQLTALVGKSLGTIVTRDIEPNCKVIPQNLVPCSSFFLN